MSFELLNQVAAELKLRFRYQSAPWKRCFADLQQNHYAGIISVSFKPERLEAGAYPGGIKPDPGKALYVEKYIVVRPKGSHTSWNGKAFQSLQGSIGVQLGYSVADDLKRYGVPIDDGALTSVDVLNKLLANRVAAVVMLQGEFGALMAEGSNRRNRLEMLPTPFAEKPYYLMLSHQMIRSQPELSERIWQTIARLKVSSAYQEKERRALNTDH